MSDPVFITLHIRSAKLGNAAVGIPVQVAHIISVVPSNQGSSYATTILLPGGMIEVVEELEEVVLAMQKAGAQVWGETKH